MSQHFASGGQSIEASIRAMIDGRDHLGITPYGRNKNWHQ